MAVHDYTIEVNDMQSHARSRVILGRYYARTKDIELSLIHYNAAMDTFSEEANPTSAVETEMLLGQVLIDAGIDVSTSDEGRARGTSTRCERKR